MLLKSDCITVIDIICIVEILRFYLRLIYAVMKKKNHAKYSDWIQDVHTFDIVSGKDKLTFCHQYHHRK